MYSMQRSPNTNCYLSDLCDDNQFKKHPLFSCDSKRLQIMVYYNEVEVFNPLGKKTKIHKLYSC